MFLFQTSKGISTGPHKLYIYEMNAFGNGLGVCSVDANSADGIKLDKKAGEIYSYNQQLATNASELKIAKANLKNAETELGVYKSTIISSGMNRVAKYDELNEKMNKATDNFMALTEKLARTRDTGQKKKIAIELKDAENEVKKARNEFTAYCDTSEMRIKENAVKAAENKVNKLEKERASTEKKMGPLTVELEQIGSRQTIKFTIQPKNAFPRGNPNLSFDDLKKQIDPDAKSTNKSSIQIYGMGENSLTPKEYVVMLNMLSSNINVDALAKVVKFYGTDYPKSKEGMNSRIQTKDFANAMADMLKAEIYNAIRSKPTWKSEASPNMVQFASLPKTISIYNQLQNAYQNAQQDEKNTRLQRKL